MRGRDGSGRPHTARLVFGVAALALLLLGVSASGEARRAGPAPGLCQTDPSRGSVPSSFAIDACIASGGVILRNNLPFPIHVDATGDVGTVARVQSDPGLAAIATRKRYPDKMLLLPSDVMRIPVGSGSATILLSNLDAAGFYGLAKTASAFWTGPVDAFTSMIAEISDDFAKYANCLVGKGVVGRALCKATLTRDITFAIGRATVTGAAKGLAGVILSAATFAKWMNDQVGALQKFLPASARAFSVAAKAPTTTPAATHPTTTAPVSTPAGSPAPSACASGCAIQSKTNGQYVSAEITRTGDGYGELRARSASIGGWEKFAIVGDCSSSSGCAIRSLANNLYVSAEISRTGDGYGTLRARASSASAWEKFALVGDCASSTGCAIRSLANQLYVSAEISRTGDGYGTLRARASSVAGWERFALVPLASGTTTTTAPAPAPARTYTEWVANPNGVNTFSNYHNASGLGPRIGYGQANAVQVSCKVLDGTIASVNPDGYWYRIASSPWNNTYYAPANVFNNGDPIAGRTRATPISPSRTADGYSQPSPSPSPSRRYGSLPVTRIGFRRSGISLQSRSRTTGRQGA
jgi:hypothetical protein